MKHKLALLINSLSNSPDEQGFQVLPAGQFRASDGRPTDVSYWEVKKPNQLLAKIAARKNDVLVDYEHKTLIPGETNPAAGWIKPTDFKWEEGQGLFVVKCEWTDAAKAYIANKEYRYISPVFKFDPKTGEVIDLVNMALTNNPALDGMKGVMAAVAQTIVSDAMNPELLKLLGLPETADDAAVLEAIKKLQTDLDAAKQELANKTQAAAATKNTETEALSSALAALTKEFNDYKDKQKAGELDTLIAANAHKLVGLEKWAKTQTIEQLTAFLNVAPNIVPATMQTQNKEPVKGDNATVATAVAALTACELQIAKAMGQTPEQFAKAKIEV